jgi:hypothetical protein
LTNVKPLFHIPNLKIIGGQSHDVVKKGIVNVETLSSGIMRIANILYFLGLKKNLLSIGKITSLGYIIMFDERQCLVICRKDY